MNTKAKRKKRPFFMVASELYTWGLERNEIAVYVFLCKMADNEDRTSTPGKKYIAANCKVSVATVYRAMRALIARGLVTSEQRYEDGHQKTNIYTVYDYPGEAFEGDTPPVTVTPLPLSKGTAYPCHGEPPTPVTVNHELYSSELNSLELGGGEAAKDPPVKVHGDPPVKRFGDKFGKVELTAVERDALTTTYGEAVTVDYINRMDAYLSAKPKAYRHHYAAICSWIMRDRATPAPARNKFQNFNQRVKDYAEIERMERAYLEQKYGEAKP